MCWATGQSELLRSRSSRQVETRRLTRRDHSFILLCASKLLLSSLLETWTAEFGAARFSEDAAACLQRPGCLQLSQ